MVYLLLILGLGLSLLFTELSLGLAHKNAKYVGFFMFFGVCCALLVGSYSNRHILGLKPIISAFIFYWLIVFIGIVINMLSRE